ncbi:reverse transcriptase domain-containing protein [Sphingobacterium siyangense]|uniref:reverse transcriptase domain-containing protein n=1 Tax=Sphingobacterium siyangense TaxID=459529 RepID=UPI003DA29774
MNLTVKQIEEICTAFNQLQTRDDLLDLLNRVKPIVFGEGCVPFEIKQLTWYINSRINKKRYQSFKIPKKSGGYRKIHAPVKGLKNIQKVLNVILQCVFIPNQFATGFVKNKSIVDNAFFHVGNNYVYNLDLKDFFTSIDQARVWKCLQLAPFNLNRDHSRAAFIEWESFKNDYLEIDSKFIDNKSYIETPFGKLFKEKGFDFEQSSYVYLPDHSILSKPYSEKRKLWLVNSFRQSDRLDIANIIAILCCTDLWVEREIDDEVVKVKKYVLPQGAPTSPILSNVICRRLDYLLSSVAKRFGAKYSRYADDITFSSMHNIYQSDGEFIKELNRVVDNQGFLINTDKTRLQKSGERQEVTGLTVNKKVNVNRSYIKELRMWVTYWERYGYERANYFYQSYLLEKNRESSRLSRGAGLDKVLAGKLDFLKMIKGSDSNLVIQITKRVDTLIQSRKQKSLKKSSLINKKVIKRTQTVIHDPLYTVDFLKQFKVADGSGFKELVHDIILTEEGFNDILNKVKKHPNFIKHYLNEYTAGIKYLNLDVVREVRKLIGHFETRGKEFFLKTGLHPVNNERDYTALVENFRLKYRYGNFRGTSSIRDSILTIGKEQGLPINTIEFLPSEKIFDARAMFFSWKDAIDLGLRYIIQGIKDHSNDGTKGGIGQKLPDVKINVERVDTDDVFYVEIKIIDVKSISLIPSDALIEYLKGSIAYRDYNKGFRNLCDWSVECSFSVELPKRINLLDALGRQEEMVELDYEPLGFTHILRFYDVR